MSDSDKDDIDNKELEKIRAKRLEEMKMTYFEGSDSSSDSWPDEPVVLTEDNFEGFIKKYPFIVRTLSDGGASSGRISKRKKRQNGFWQIEY